MNVPPILAALRKHKAGTFLIGLQVALTLAIVCNIVFIVAQRVQRIDRPTGVDGKDLFLITQSFVDAPTGNDPSAVRKLDSLQLTDLATLRALPDVESATPVSALPLLNSGNAQYVSTQPGPAHRGISVDMFSGDGEMVQTLGLKLVAGRGFNDLDVRRHVPGGKYDAPAVMLTRALADKLFPVGNAVGKPIYINGNTAPSTVVGVVARMLTFNADGPESTAYDSFIVPVRIVSRSTMYAVRAKPGRLEAAMRESRAALFKVDPMRVIQSSGRYFATGIHSFGEIRSMGYSLDMFMVQILTLVCVILLLITGIGMTGLTSFWVRQRHKQIGIRRALGATRANVLHYFQLENLFIAGIGCIVGIVLAILINLALLTMFQMGRMPVWYVLVGIVVILLLGQIAVFMPARRASNVPPVVATRSV